ncbi:PxKF domain-containing protein [Phytoactinopolyspora mesophila]|uniref:Uncharacterized protein n=1 Tax=Phytoactinopolyspora mesophila TaxID=2650750 RepID=A0A7K3MA37_9ACTN|nr:PxKF domain-containing protein [Phytoactinopolyspora mesophila]NDL60154.1 hypothetical protein [Phytoactinopolyspora mesophila]
MELSGIELGVVRVRWALDEADVQSVLEVEALVGDHRGEKCPERRRLERHDLKRRGITGRHVAIAVAVCTSGAPNGAQVPARSPHTYRIPYDTGSGTYRYVWLTDRSWSGSCRQLTLTTDDGGIHTARFRFE